MVGSKYFIERNGLRSGPFTSQELKDLAVSGNVLFSDLIRKEGIEHAVPAYKVHGLFPPATREVLGEISVDASSEPVVKDEHAQDVDD
jgi:hypothetical protein